MPIQEFWNRVRAAVGLMKPKVVATSSLLDADHWESDLEKADLWLTPRVVEGFDPADFTFLSEHEQHTLSDAVDHFREVALQVPNRGLASKEQIALAKPQLERILGVLRPEKYNNVDAFELGKQLEQALKDTGQLPVWVRDFRFESGADSIGERALWIWLMVDDEVLEAEHPSERVRDVQDLVENCLSRITTDRWPYIHFRTVSEQQALPR